MYMVLFILFLYCCTDTVQQGTEFLCRVVTARCDVTIIWSVLCFANDVKGSLKFDLSGYG